MKNITKQDAVKLIQSQGNSFFSVKFVKKDKTVREMNCRLNVKKHLKGGELKYNPFERGLIPVFDAVSRGYRMINIETLLELNCNKESYKITDNYVSKVA